MHVDSKAKTKALFRAGMIDEDYQSYLIDPDCSFPQMSRPAFEKAMTVRLAIGDSGIRDSILNCTA